MAFDEDKTILENAHQTDKWSIPHVLCFFVFSWQGVPWWVNLLIIYSWKGMEALPFIDYATAEDGLIVDPVEAAFGVIMWRFVAVTTGLPTCLRYPSCWAETKRYLWWIACCWGPVALIERITAWGPRVAGSEYVWIPLVVWWWLACVYLNTRHGATHQWKGWLAALTYMASYTGIQLWLLSIPYNGFFAACYGHAPFVLWWVVGDASGAVHQDTLSQRHVLPTDSPK